jgi:hypothetical protein
MEMLYFPVLSMSMDDFGVPGVVIVVDPLEADEYGAFLESALDEADVIESQIAEGGLVA